MLPENNLLEKANGSTPLTIGTERSRSAKDYSRLKYALAIADIIYLIVLLFLFQGLGFSKIMADYISQLVGNSYLVIPAYLLAIYLIYYFLDFPLTFYRSFILEHKFSLTNQKIGDWLKDQIKAGAIAYIVSIILLSASYHILKEFPVFWWLIVSLFWIFFSLVFAKLMPILVIPLFFKYKKLSEETLRQRIIRLAEKMRVKILDVFEIDFSKKTLKANACFLGWGRTRRVILADTLKDKYNFEEIEVILAHEFAHYRLRHLLKLILVNSLATMLVFYLIFKTSAYFLGLFGLSSLSDIASLPLVFIYLVIFGVITQPFKNYISRGFERNADRLAIEVTGLKVAFISMMDKLARQNLADRNPRPWIKFFFFDHPPINERIAMAEP